MTSVCRALVVLVVVSSSALAQTGSIAGRVVLDTTRVPNARVLLDGARETRSDSVGRFRFANVVAGRHSLEVRSLGSKPVSEFVIVPTSDSIEVVVQIEKVVTLDPVRVEGSTVRDGFVRDYVDRKRMGFGKFMDSTEVRRYYEVRQAVLRMPGARCERTCDIVLFPNGMGGSCLPNVWVDTQNWGTEQGVLKSIQPEDVMGIEAYTRESSVPEEFRARGRQRGCGALVIWTRRMWPQGKKKP